MDKSIINAQRTRKIKGSFGWIEHRFIREGYIKMLCKREMLLYFFLALAADKNGISFYSPDKAMALLQLTEEAYFGALAALENKDFIIRQGNKVQLLSLPEKNEEIKVSIDTQKRNGKMLSMSDILKEAGYGQR